jgi:hypothetical protein
VLVDGMDIYDSEYAIWRPVYKDHAYRKVRMEKIEVLKEFAAEGKKPRNDEFPRPLAPVDDLPPATVITHVIPGAAGKLEVRGTTADNGTVQKVLVNGRPARALAANFAQWEVVLENQHPGVVQLAAHAEDAAGNVEKVPHILKLTLPRRAAPR